VNQGSVLSMNRRFEGATDTILGCRLMSTFPWGALDAYSRRDAEDVISRSADLPQLAFEQMGAGVIGCNQAGVITGCNQTVRDWLGGVCGETWPTGLLVTAADGHSPVSPEQWPFARILNGESVVNVDLVIPAGSDQAARRLLGVATPLREPDGSRSGAVLVMHDITERSDSGGNLLGGNHPAASATTANGNILSAMSHELRTPLSAILGFSHLLRREASLSVEHASYLDLINHSGEHLLSIIDEALDMSKIEAGALPVDLTVVCVSDEVQHVAATLLPRAEEKNIGLEVFCDWHGSVRTDAGKLRRVLFNLLGNALKFTASGNVVVRLGLGREGDNGSSRLSLTVEDTGPGIAALDLERIFEPFFRADGSSGQQGTGLGLTITRQYIELLGGTITATSTVGAGSCFRVELPVQIVDQARSTLSRSAPAEGYRVATGQRVSRVLIVEDHRINASLLSRTLEKAGFLVRIAETGTVAIEIFETWSPDFIWMDAMMPGLSGKDTVQAIRALHGGRDVKIVALSACSLREQGAAMLAAGCDEFLMKPTPTAAVVACVARHLGLELVADEIAVSTASAVPWRARERTPDLPVELRADLRAAILSLDPARIATVIDQLNPIAPERAERLRHYAGRLDYSTLLAMIDG
jgi:signal transduction histidine kinase/CheY-like chemotaxis protein